MDSVPYVFGSTRGASVRLFSLQRKVTRRLLTCLTWLIYDTCAALQSMSKTAGQKKILLSHEFCRCLRVLPLRLQRFLQYCRRFRILPAVLRPLSACDNMAVTAHFTRPLFIFFCGVNMQRRTPSHVLSLINFIKNILGAKIVMF